MHNWNWKNKDLTIKIAALLTDELGLLILAQQSNIVIGLEVRFTMDYQGLRQGDGTITK